MGLAEHRRIAAWLSLAGGCGSLLVGCGRTGWSLYVDTDVESTTYAVVETGEGETGGESESETSGDGDGDTSGEGDGDGEPGPCGNGLVEDGEECDEGRQNAPGADCTPACTLAVCGDGFVHARDEECDDQNRNDDDACHDDCTRTEVVQLALGGEHTCALLDHGKLICWGNGDDGRTGYGTVENVGDDEPAGSFGVVDLGGTAEWVAAGADHTCVGFADGQLRCFGRPFDGQLGYGNTEPVGDDEVPASVGFVDLGGPLTDFGLEGTAAHACAALAPDARVVCWGHENEGRLGYALGDLAEDVGDDEIPAQWLAAHGPVEVGGAVVELCTGQAHSCARLDDGTVRCWGESSSAQLGYGQPVVNIGDDETPASAGPIPMGAPVTDISCGLHHNCAILEGGAVKCWGRGNDGRLGYGDVKWVGFYNTPADVDPLDLGPGTPVKIDSGIAHNCVLMADGHIRCWGRGSLGQLGYGNATNIGDNEVPATAGEVDIGGLALDVAVDGSHTCAIREDGRVLCWGRADEGRLGYGNLDYIGDDELPVSAGPVPLF